MTTTPTPNTLVSDEAMALQRVVDAQRAVNAAREALDEAAAKRRAVVQSVVDGGVATTRVAELLGVTQQRVYKIMRGKS